MLVFRTAHPTTVSKSLPHLQPERGASNRRLRVMVPRALQFLDIRFDPGTIFSDVFQNGTASLLLTLLQANREKQ